MVKQTSNPSICEKMKTTVDSYLSKKMSPHDFEVAFLSLRRSKIESKSTWLEPEISDAMDRIFSAVDRFYDGEDPDDIDLTAEQLYEEVYSIWNAALSNQNSGRSSK